MAEIDIASKMWTFNFHGSLRLSNSLKDFHLFMDGCLLSRHLGSLAVVVRTYLSLIIVVIWQTETS